MRQKKNWTTDHNSSAWKGGLSRPRHTKKRERSFRGFDLPVFLLEKGKGRPIPSPEGDGLTRACKANISIRIWEIGGLAPWVWSNMQRLFSKKRLPCETQQSNVPAFIYDFFSGANKNSGRRGSKIPVSFFFAEILAPPKRHARFNNHPYATKREWAGRSSNKNLFFFLFDNLQSVQSHNGEPCFVDLPQKNNQTPTRKS